MLSRTFTKQQLQLNQLKHKQFPQQMEFDTIKNDENNSSTIFSYT